MFIGSDVTNIDGSAFAKCPELVDVYCLAENVPETSSNAFQESYPEYSTLHVPAASFEAYKTTVPWSSFGTVVTLETGDIPDEPEPEPTPTQAEIQLGAGKTMAGYSFSETLDFTNVTNGKAWIASGFVDGGKVMLSRVSVVPAKTGFLVTTEIPGDKIVAPVSDRRAIYGTLLVPILDDTMHDAQ